MAAGLAHFSGVLDGKIDSLPGFVPGSGAARSSRGAGARVSRRRGDVRCKLVKKQGGGDEPTRDPAQKRPRWLSPAALVAGCVAVAAAGLSRLRFENAGGSIGGSGGNAGGGGDGGGENPAPVPGTELLRKSRGSDEDEEEKPAKFRVLASLSSAAVESSLDQSKTEETVQRFKGQASFNFETNRFNVQLKPDDEKGARKEPAAKELGEVSDVKETLPPLKTWEKLQPPLKMSISDVKEKPLPPVTTPTPDQVDEKPGRLAGLIESALDKAGMKSKRSLNEEERKKIAKEVAAAVLEQVASDNSLAKKSETGALKRLQQEAFTDIMKARDRLDKFELSVAELKRSIGGADRTSLRARVAAGGAFVLMQDQSSLSSRSALEQSGIPAGLDVDFTFQTPFREADLLTTKCVTGEGAGSSSRTLGGPVRLEKIHYVAQVSEDIKVSFAPLGAEAKDMTSTVNPVQDDALTRFSRTGPQLFDYCRGSAFGASYQTPSTLLTVSQHLSGWGEGSDPVCLSTLAQAVHQPSESFVFSFSGLNRVWPSPPLPSTPGLHWSEMGPLVFSSTSASGSTSNPDILRSSDWRSSGETPAFQPKGTSMQSVAVSGEVKLGGLATLGGWFQFERGDWLVQQDQKQPQWFLSLIKTSSEGVSGGVCVGKSKRDYLTTSFKDEENSSPQLQLEAFLKVDCGQGFWLQPGLLYIINKHCQTPGVMLKAEWKL